MDMLRQRVYGPAHLYDYCNDAQTLRHDERTSLQSASYLQATLSHPNLRFLDLRIVQMMSPSRIATGVCACVRSDAQEATE